MKVFCLMFLATLSLNSIAKAEEVFIGCIYATYDCVLVPNKPNHCFWAYQSQGSLLAVDIKKTGNGPNYEIWEGNLDSIAKDIPYHLSIYQRRESNLKVNFVSIDMKIKSLSISAMGQEVTQAKYFNEAIPEGFALRCDTNISPAP